MPPNRLRSGDVIGGHYRVARHLGSGGFGQVVLAEDDVVVGRRVAIKILHASNSVEQDDLVREMEIPSRNRP